MSTMTHAAPADAKAEALKAKAEAEKARQARIKAANQRLAALPRDAQTRVKGNAARAEQDGKAAGKRAASVSYLEDALTAEEAKGTAGTGTLAAAPEPERPVKAVPRPKGPRETSKPKETPGQLAPEKKAKKTLRKRAAEEHAAAVDAAHARRTGPAAVKATVTVEVPATHKTCTRCHESKPVADFLNKNGTGKPRPTCRPCYNESWREFDKARKAKKAAEQQAAAAS